MFIMWSDWCYLSSDIFVLGTYLKPRFIVELGVWNVQVLLEVYVMMLFTNRGQRASLMQE